MKMTIPKRNRLLLCLHRLRLIYQAAKNVDAVFINELDYSIIRLFGFVSERANGCRARRGRDNLFQMRMALVTHDVLDSTKFINMAWRRYNSNCDCGFGRGPEHLPRQPRAGRRVSGPRDPSALAHPAAETSANPYRGEREPDLPARPSPGGGQVWGRPGMDTMGYSSLGVKSTTHLSQPPRFSNSDFFQT